MTDRPRTRAQPAAPAGEKARLQRARLRRELTLQARREAYWRGVLVGVALGIPSTATAVWLWTGLNLLTWWR